MSLTLPGRRERPARKHRAIDRLAAAEQELAELRSQLADADALIMRQAIRCGELETGNGELAERLQTTQDALINVGRDRDALERHLGELEKQIADRDRRLDVQALAEAAATETQPIPVITPVPLHRAPFATVDPGRVHPAWAKDDPAA
ncbi:hypothetical protein AB0F36_14495 [Streptomyces sp. NPDC029080]|uniref:hypothetical protein n=1 Tax=Streptomyces sp. NPDC029080 TaxID=3155017 RepID=UPI0033C229DB